MNRRIFNGIVLVSLALCLIVVVLGAWVRLSDAGLGCPDWPTCYGHLTAGGALQNQQAVNALHPDRPLEYHKALREMIHRYAAGTLGLLILVLAAAAVWNRRDPGQPVLTPVLLLVLVIVQALLGMLTVTWLLKPTIVTLHLLGGMTVLALLAWLVLPRGSREEPRILRTLAVLTLVVLIAQIALGGWTSSNYAAISCPDFPRCQGRWWPQADFSEAFVLWRGLGIDYEGGVLHHLARVAIHFTHRIGALLVSLFAGALGLMALLRGRGQAMRLAGAAVLTALALQLMFGIGMVVKGFPLAWATAHNAGAAILLLAVVALLRRTCVNTGS